MKKCIFITVISVIALTANVRALTLTGSITTASNTLIGNAAWETDTALSWVVDNTTNAGFWTYTYTFTNDLKDLSHAIIEVSENFTVDNIVDNLTTGGYEGPDNYGSGMDNPGIPGTMWGVKWNTSSTTGTTIWTIVTDRAPMWGDFYAKDGKDGIENVYAYNSKFGMDTDALISNGNAGGWVLVPDTATGVIPEPGTFMLLGTGLLGLIVYSWRRKKRN
jgi:hypothetical protein